MSFVTALAVNAAAGPWSPSDEEHFLLTAQVESVALVEEGLTGSKKAMLTDGHRQHAAHIQSVDIHMPLFRGKDGSQERDFVDSWKFNVAAYRLAKLLHLADMVPVSVPREFEGKPSEFSWWVDDVAMDERARVAKKLQPPDIPAWNRQMDTIRVFDQLIYNMDRSQENLLITSDWHVWMIDHTRAFRKWKTLRRPEAITKCSPELLHALKALRRKDVERDLGPFLTPEEIDGLMARRDLIVEKLERQGATSTMGHVVVGGHPAGFPIIAAHAGS